MAAAFTTDPFLGLVCSNCEMAIGQKKNWSIRKHVYHHLSEKHKDDMSPNEAEHLSVWWQDEIVEKLRGYARHQVVQPDLVGERNFLIQWLKPDPQTVGVCDGCNRIKCDVVNRRGNHTPGCKGGRFILSPNRVHVHIFKLAGGGLLTWTRSSTLGPVISFTRCITNY
jgi:hypothetical protein